MTIKLRDGEIYLTRDGKKVESTSPVRKVMRYAVREAGVL